MEWSEEYAIGVEHIDEQHKGLFRACSRVMKILRDGDMDRNRRICIEAIKYLKHYTLQHFSDEEAYQREIGYAGYDEHKAQHDAFIGTVLEQEKHMEEENYSRDSVRRLMDMLTAWLVNHIMNSDQRITHGEPQA